MLARSVTFVTACIVLLCVFATGVESVYPYDPRYGITCATVNCAGVGRTRSKAIAYPCEVDLGIGNEGGLVQIRKLLLYEGCSYNTCCNSASAPAKTCSSYACMQGYYRPSNTKVCANNSCSLAQCCVLSQTAVLSQCPSYDCIGTHKTTAPFCGTKRNPDYYPNPNPYDPINCPNCQIPHRRLLQKMITTTCTEALCCDSLPVCVYGACSATACGTTGGRVASNTPCDGPQSQQCGVTCPNCTFAGVTCPTTACGTSGTMTASNAASCTGTKTQTCTAAACATCASLTCDINTSKDVGAGTVCGGISCDQLECCGANAVCSSINCDAGTSKNQDPGTVCDGLGCSQGECCGANSVCSSVTCDAGTSPDVAATTPCDGLTCIQQECCGPNAQCGDGSLTCGAGETATNAGTTCTAVTCTPGECCAANGTCPAACGAGKHSIKTGACTTATCAADECCTDNNVCSTVSCADGENIVDTGKVCAAKDCTTLECCGANGQCSSVTCEAGTHTKGAAVVCAGGSCSQTECCNPNNTCSTHVCDTGTSKSANDAVVCAAASCINTECCTPNEICGTTCTGAGEVPVAEGQPCAELKCGAGECCSVPGQCPERCPAGEHVIKVGACSTTPCFIEPYQVETKRVGECCGQNQKCDTLKCPPNMDAKTGMAEVVCATKDCLADQCCVKKPQNNAGSGDTASNSKKEEEDGLPVAMIAGIVAALVVVVVAVVVIKGRASRSEGSMQNDVTRMSMGGNAHQGAGGVVQYQNEFVQNQQQYGNGGMRV